MKIVIKQHRFVGAGIDNMDFEYEVIGLVDRTEPCIGTIMSKKELEDLLHSVYYSTSAFNQDRTEVEIL